MTENFDAAFLERLAAIAAVIDAENPARDPFDGQTQLDATLAEPMFEDGGDDLAATKATIRELRNVLAQAFAAILQHISSDRGLGSIAALDDRTLSGIVREGVELARNWDEPDIGKPTRTEPFRRSVTTAELQRLLTAHHEIDAAIMNFEEKIFGGDDDED